MKTSRNLIYGEKIAVQSMIVIIFYTAIKIIVALITGINVMLADALASLTDLVSIFASFIGIKLSKKSANKNFEYGYYKTETLASLIVSLLIIYLGYRIFSKAVIDIGATGEGKYHIIAIIASILSIFVAWILFRKLKDASIKINSKSLLDNASEKKMDMIVQVGVLVSIVSDYMNIRYVESITTIFISFLIFKVGLTSAKEALFYLLDYWDDPKLIKKIKTVIKTNGEIITGVKKIKMRRAGTFIFGEIFVEIDPFADLIDLGEELKLIGQKIKDLNPYILDCSIFTYIHKGKSVKIGIPVAKGKGLSSRIARDLKSTHSYEFVILKNNKIIKKYKKKLNAKSKGTDKLIAFLKKEKVNLIIDNGLNSLVYYDLKKYHHIQVYPSFSNTGDVEEAIKLLTIDL